MRILVCGGREFGDHRENEGARGLSLRQLRLYRHQYDFIWLTLWSLSDEFKFTTVIQGGTRGADQAALDWAHVVGVNLDTYEADWEKHGKAAGPIRNQQMLDEGRPDLVVAYPGGRGTADMVRRAKKAGVEVRVIEYPL